VNYFINEIFFFFEQVEGEEIPKAQLLDKQGNINPKAQRIFEWIFNRYQRDDKMNREQSAMFIKETTNGECHADDPRISRLFATYDTDHDDFLTKENFV
jgi:hypothetical protein